ncbi:hypothetical protein D3C83_226630 [compost metagenome]
MLASFVVSELGSLRQTAKGLGLRMLQCARAFPNHYFEAGFLLMQREMQVASL